MATTMTIKKRMAPAIAVSAALLVVLSAPNAFAMHISDGILSAGWASFWFAAVLPVVAIGLGVLKKKNEASTKTKPFVALIGAAIFVISCMPIPVPVAGTTSHPCGVGLAAILIGPWLAVVVSSVTLALQALFLSHGGLTSLGADIFSMGVVGAFSGYASFRLVRWLGFSTWAAAFAAGLVSDWATYATTSLQLALALHGNAPLFSMFAAIAAAFIPTQLPLGILEGFISAGAYRFVMLRKPELACGGAERKFAC